MKELYDDVKIEVVILEAKDIIATSDDYGGAGIGGLIDSGSLID